MIVIVFGLPGSGKSYFASALSALIDAEYINSDRVRNEMLESKTYSLNERLSVYDEMLRQMKHFLKLKKNVLLDATFYKETIRDNFTKQPECKDGILFIEVKADESVIRERLKNPRTHSDADFKVYKIIKEQWEDLEKPHLILQSANDNIVEMLDKTLDYLHLKDDKRTDK